MIYPLFAADASFRLPRRTSPLGRRRRHESRQPLRRATESQEGVRIPRSRSWTAAGRTTGGLDLIFSNMRGAREAPRDYQAMLGTAEGDRANRRLVARYGATTICEAVAELMDRAEGRMRRAIRELRAASTSTRRTWRPGPSGSIAHGARERSSSNGDTITVDLTGTSPQTLGPTNVGPREWRRPAPSRSSSRSSIPAPT